MNSYCVVTMLFYLVYLFMSLVHISGGISVGRVLDVIVGLTLFVWSLVLVIIL